MNRQNNLKIIITTVIVLIISAMVVFTIVKWAEIEKKFLGAASKADGYEKIERNTVPPPNANNVATNKIVEEPNNGMPDSKEETKIPKQLPNEDNLPIAPKDTQKFNKTQKELPPIGLNEPPIINSKDPSNPIKYTGSNYDALNNSNNFDKKSVSSKSVKSQNNQKLVYKKKSYKKIKSSKTHYAKTSNLDKRISFLEKKLGIAKPSKKKKSSLESRIYRLEKIISKKKN